MVDMNTLISLQSTIFLLILAGYIMTRAGILPVSARGALSDLVIDFIMPCNIIVSFLIDLDREILVSCLTVFAVSVCIQIAAVLAGGRLYPGTDEGERAVLKYATIVSNAGFLGNPVAQGLYGDIGLLYASIYLIPIRIFMWSSGISCFSGTKGKNVIKKVLTHPCIIAVMIGLVLMLAQATLSSWIETPLRTAGNCNTALSMIVIGNILAEINFRDVVSKKVLWYCFVRLLLIPVTVFFCCRAVGTGGTVNGVSTVLAGMPAPATVAILAAKYHGDEHFAVKIVFLSTLLSLVTIPGLCLFMAWF